MATAIPQNRAEFELSELLEATSGKLIHQGSLSRFCGIGTDSREELSGKVFVALRGERFDAHDFLERAVEAGASLLVVERLPEDFEVPDELGVVRVSDSLLALGALARVHRRRWAGRLVAVVGSAGKTTTRSVISSLLEEVHPGRVLATRGNLNNQIGVPMTLFGLEACHDYAVVELGTNQPGEVALLARMACADVAVMTLIDLEHTEGLGDLDGVEREENAAFQHIEADGVAIGFGEDERVLRSVQAAKAKRRLTYGFDPERDLWIEDRGLESERLARVSLKRADGSRLTVLSPLVGRPGALAVAAGVLATEELQGAALTASVCEKALKSAGEPGRNSLVEMSGNRWVVDDTYNSNPASVQSSIGTGQELSERTGGRLFLVLGEMLELGHLAKNAHEQMGLLAAQSNAAGVFFVQGDARVSFEHCDGKVPLARFYSQADAVASELAPLLQPNDVVVVKASRGVRAERVVQGLADRLGKRVSASAPISLSGENS